MCVCVYRLCFDAEEPVEQSLSQTARTQAAYSTLGTITSNMVFIPKHGHDIKLNYPLRSFCELLVGITDRYCVVYTYVGDIVSHTPNWKKKQLIQMCGSIYSFRLKGATLLIYHCWISENEFRLTSEVPAQGGGGRLWCSWWSRRRGRTTPFLASPLAACEAPGGQRWYTECRGLGRSLAVHGRQPRSGFVSHHCRAWASGSGADRLPPGAAWWARLWVAT